MALIPRMAPTWPAWPVLVLTLMLPASALPARPIQILPHQAIYNLSIAAAKSGNPVVAVDGGMMIKWADVCDGWTLEQRFTMTFIYAQGGALEMKTTFVTWEAKDGLSYRFNVRKLVNGEVDEVIRGEASLDGPGQGGTVQFEEPEKKAVPLPPGTLFPTEHTLELLKRAQAGKRFFFRTVFDGIEASGPTDINAVIGEQVTVAREDWDDAVFGGPAWPMRLAFFTPDGDQAVEGGGPDYEVSIQLLWNGVSDSMLIDYGDLKIDVALDTIEELPAPHC